MTPLLQYPYWMRSNPIRQIYPWILGIYCLTLALGVFTPRSDLTVLEISPVTKHSNNQFSNLNHSILYLDGLLAWDGNFFLLMPLAVLIHLSFSKTQFRTIFTICLSTTISIESIQAFIPGRISSVEDIYVNSLGALAAISLVKLITRRINRKAHDTSSVD